MLVSVILYAFLKLYLITNIYQQSHYQLKMYLKHFLINFVFYDLFPLIVFVVGYYQDLLIVKIICSIYLFLFSLFYLICRIRLKFTKRCVRFCILAILYCSVVFIPYVGPYFLLLLEFSIIPILLLEQMISYFMNKPYIKRATLKMKDYHGKIIAITGSFGKTSVKNLFLQSLSLYFTVAATEKSYNTELGISKFINQIPDLNLYDYLIFEFGASHKKDISKLKRIVQPDVVVVTGIGLMHVETFGSLDDIIHEKMSIVTGASLAILNYDCDYIKNYPIPKNVKVLSYGLSSGEFQAKNVLDHLFDFYQNDTNKMTLNHPFVGKHPVLNMLSILSYLSYLNCDLERFKRGVMTFQLVEHRLQLKEFSNRKVLDDSFNSNYQGFIEALNILKNNQGKRVLLTPGMVELGRYKKELFNGLSSYIVASADIVILIGYHQTRLLYQVLKEFQKEVYLVRNFMEGYALYLEIVKKEKDSLLLIENDVPDLYRVGLI